MLTSFVGHSEGFGNKQEQVNREGKVVKSFKIKDKTEDVVEKRDQVEEFKEWGDTGRTIGNGDHIINGILNWCSGRDSQRGKAREEVVTIFQREDEEGLAEF